MNAPEGEETIFAEALRLPPDERAAYLAQSTHGNAELRRRVESLLGSYEAGDFLEKAAATQSRQTLQATVPLTERPGDRIGRYKLLEQIGEGGCGVVYVAEQVEPVRRRVALKIIKLGMDTKSVIARFEAERQALALMDHPNIAKVLDAGATDSGARLSPAAARPNADARGNLSEPPSAVETAAAGDSRAPLPAGRPYFVMELVRGMKITDYCDGKKLSTRQRLDLFIQVCQAIQHAHQKGIIHRDIKPSNILVTVNDGVPVPKVIDFGIAKATSGQQLTDKTIYTAFEQFIGTPAYMSPEQAVLTSLDIDTRSDIYALGVLLYELLTGKTPFDAKKLLAIGLDEMRRTIREQEPPRPSTRLSTLPGQELSTTAQRRGLDAPKLVSELRGDLDWIVMKALEKDRARRYETANGLAMDIQRHLSNEPVVACPPSAAYRFKKLVRRNKLVFTAGGGIVAALIVGLAVSTWMFFKERQAHQRAVAAENTARTESSKSRQVAQFLQEMLKGVGPSAALGRDTTMLREILDKTAERAGQDLKDQPHVEAELRNTIGEVYFAIGAYQKAAERHRAALAIRQKLFGDEHLDVASSLNNLGVAIDYEKKFADAEAPLRKALALRRKYLSNDHPDLATSLHNLAHVLVDLNKPADAEPLYVEALAMRRKLFGDEDLDVVRSLVQLAALRDKQGRLAEAETMHREALATRRKLLNNEHPEVAHSLSYLAMMLLNEGKLAEAERAQSEALAIQRKLFADDYSGLGDSLLRMGRVLQGQGRLVEAETFFREAVNNRRNLDPSHPDAFRAHTFLAGVLNRQGKFAEARAILRQAAERGDPNAQNELAWQMATSDDPKLRDGPTAVSLAEKAVMATNRKNPSFLDTLAAAYAEAGQFAKAVSIQQEAIALSQDEGQKKELVFRLELFKANSPFASAVEWMNKALIESGKELERDVQAYMVLAMAHYQLNQTDAARAAFARGTEIEQMKLPKLESGDIGDSWLDWIIAHALMREAKALIEGAPETKAETK
jgi:serine/threonine protein kinase/tetratricopeptide (TPR) repeat protein